MYVCVHVSACNCHAKARRVSDFLELELQAAMNHVVWVLGIELWSLKEQDLLTSHLTFPAPQIPVF